LKWLLIVILITGCAMRFEDVEIGGIENGPVNIKTVGDKDKAAQYIRHARVVLGNLKQYMQLNEYTSLQTEVKLADGTKIRAMSNTNGLTDIDKVFIDVPTTAATTTNEPPTVLGYIVFSNKDFTLITPTEKEVGNRAKDSSGNAIDFNVWDAVFVGYPDNGVKLTTLTNSPEFQQVSVNDYTEGTSWDIYDT